MCIRGKCRRATKGLALAATLLAATCAVAQAGPASYLELEKAVQPAPVATQPAGANAAEASAPATKVIPGSEPGQQAPAQPVLKRPKKKIAAAKPVPAPQPLDPYSSGGTTHQDPLLLLGVVAFALYRRYHHDDDFAPAYTTLPPDDPELLRSWQRQFANPAIVLPPELPKAFRMTSFSWTATVPGGAVAAAAPVVEIAAPHPEAPTAAAAAKPVIVPSTTRVLLVGGEPNWVRFQTDVLRGDGAEVERCPAMQRAIDLLARSSFDVVIVDSEMTGDNSAPVIRRWLAQNRPGMEKRLVVTVGNLCDARTSALLEEARALTLTRPCGVQDLLVMVRLASQRGAPALA